MFWTLAMALVCFFMGGHSIHVARKGMAAGKAETEEAGTIHRKREPLRFRLFLWFHFAFGGFFLILGLVLTLGFILLWRKGGPA